MSVLFITIIAAMGGFLFGYDTAVISGAIGPLSKYFALDSIQIGWATSCALCGCAVGALGAGQLTERFGRKKTMAFSALLFLISGVGTALPESFIELIIFRILGGLGIGVSSIVCPMYIAEIAPAEKRGQLVSLNQLAIVSGIFGVYFINYLITCFGDYSWSVEIGWRYMLGSEAIPSLVYLILLFFIPESPRWLILKKREIEAKDILRRFMSLKDADKQISTVKQTALSINKIHWSNLLSTKTLPLLLIGAAISFFQQTTGINAFIYYAPEIFKQLGQGFESSMLQTVILGGVNFIFTILAIYGIDRWGRKPLLLWGSALASICLLAMAYGTYLKAFPASVSLFFVLLFIAAFAFSLGPVTWVLLSEIFPNQLRSYGLALAVFVQWVTNFVVSQTFPIMLDHSWLKETFNGAFPFLVYGISSALCFIFVVRFITETKGQTLEQIAHQAETPIFSMRH